MKIRRATPLDLGGIVRLRKAAADWLRSSGSDQWSDSGLGMQAFTSRVSTSIDQGNTWVIDDCHCVIGTIGLDTRTDDDGLWTASEQEKSLFIHRMITDREQRGRGLGEELLRWADQVALILDLKTLRLDAWNSSEGLHRYYERHGFTHLRTVPNHRYPSSTLYQRKVPGSIQRPAPSDTELSTY